MLTTIFYADNLLQFFKGLNTTVDQKKTFRKAFHAYYNVVTELLQFEHASLHQMEHENAKILNAKGELSEENASLYEKLQKSYDHLYRNISSDSESGSGTIEPEGHDEDDLDEENHDDEDDGGPAPDEDEVHVRQKVAELDPQEVVNFDQELRAVVQESMEQRKLELRGRPTLNMMIPMNVFEGSIKDHHGRLVGGESGDEALDEEAGGSQDVQVKVLVKRGNKQQTKQMYIPRDCTLVQSTKQKEAAEFEEKQDIKRLVLEYNDRVEEENNGLGTQTLNWPSGNSRAYSRGNSWQGFGGKSGGPHH